MPGKKKAPTRRAKVKDPVLPAVNPVVEDHLDPSESLPFPIVAIGASAGGLEAFTSLLGHLAPNTGMAFVMLQHLSPTQQSLLSEILGRSTSMPVRRRITSASRDLAARLICLHSSRNPASSASGSSARTAL